MTTVRDPLDRMLGAKTAKPLSDAFGLQTVGDLLRHYPRRYATRGELTDLSSLREGEHVTVLAKVVLAQRRPNGNRRGERLEVTVTDGRARLTLTFFHRAGFHQKILRPEAVGLFAGTVSSFRGRRQLVHPECEMLPETSGMGLAAEIAADYATELIPVYPASAKIASWQIARAVQTVLDPLDAGEDPLPEELRQRYGLIGLAEAIRAIHRPLDDDDRRRARLRLKWDEAFVLQAALAQRRNAAAAMPATPRPRVPGGLAEAFDARLPFRLTDGQRAAGETISADLACAYPMHRLLQGEVGSGKTVIAVRAMLQVIDAGGQAALLAPTEVLAQQHFRSISAMLGPLGQAGQLGGAEHATRVALLTGSQGAAARREALTDVFTGDAGIVIGTHALLEEHVRFSDLGLIVIDEQHRFGVEQRDALREKAPGGRPHVLVMTATPIPRTVAMTVYGDLEVSTLTELPAGRSPIVTHVVPAADKPRFVERAWERVREEAAHGRQAYVVCPRVGGADPGEPDDGGPDDPGTAGGDAIDGDATTPDGRRPPLAVLDMTPALQNGPLAGLRVAALHGRMPSEEKERVMRAFTEGDLDVLVATTVIEVGVDVPNATVMVVMDADRFGVSQLHQLRGRVGRGTAEGLCLLVTETEPGSPARERLDAVAGTVDGFSLSRLDLEQRREGDVLGAAQAGRRSSLKLLSLLADEELIGQAREEAAAVVDSDPELARHPGLSAAIGDLLGPQRAEFLDKT
jgi:ATP-dependent DNA helicase RecG